jgi:hypothetical protein
LYEESVTDAPELDEARKSKYQKRFFPNFEKKKKSLRLKTKVVPNGWEPRKNFMEQNFRSGIVGLNMRHCQ